MLIGYARVSTRDQKPHLQLDALQQAGCERIFEETVSGAKRDRPAMETVLDNLRPGDSLVVWKLDRLARSTRQLLETVEALGQRGIGLKILTQNIDSTTAGGRLIVTVFSAIAEFEREIIRERTRAGLDAARLRGAYRRAPPGSLRERSENSACLAGRFVDYGGGRNAAARRWGLHVVPLPARGTPHRASNVTRYHQASARTGEMA